jgi:hypothetical protein
MYSEKKVYEARLLMAGLMACLATAVLFTAPAK